jgi:tight adherence protein B
MRAGNVTGVLSITPFVPLLVGLFSAFICAVGVWLHSHSSIAPNSGRETRRPQSRFDVFFEKNSRHVVQSLIVSAVVTFIVFLWTSSIVISFPFTFFSGVVSWKILRNRSLRVENQLLEVWPEVTDHLISALHSGMSLSEALVGLSTRGPIAVRPYFCSFHETLLRTGDFSGAVETLRDRFSSHGSDQIFEAIFLAKSLGGSELLQVFRTLGDFLRQDLAVRKEIEIKHGWIKSSAHLSSAAPWLLLLLLSSQPSTAKAFNQPSGVLILLLGLILTGVAYFWMGKLGKLPSSARVFDGELR